MKPVTTKLEGDLIIQIVDKRADVESLTAFVQANIASWVGKPMIWNITAYDFERMSHNEVQAFTRAIDGMSHVRAGDRTAFVAEQDLAYGMARTFLSYAESDNVPVQRGLFRTMDEARNWVLARLDRDDEA